MTAYKRIARIAKTRNLEGSLVVNAAPGLPFLLECGMQVHFVPPVMRMPRTSVVESIQDLGADSFEVHFSQVNDRATAEALVGCWCLVLRSCLPSDVHAEVAPVGLVGWQVKDEELGALGTIVEVQDNAGQNLLIVQGDRGEVMIPVVDEFITGVDEAAETVLVSIPLGLVGLNSAE